MACGCGGTSSRMSGPRAAAPDVARPAERAPEGRSLVTYTETWRGPRAIRGKSGAVYRFSGAVPTAWVDQHDAAYFAGRPGFTLSARPSA